MIVTDIQLIKKTVENGEVIGLPTETVYGLAANAFNETAIRKIYELKGRPSTNPLIVHIGHADQLKDIVSSVPEKLKQLADAFWPGGLTLLFPKNESISPIITAGFPNIAVRMPTHPLAQSLLKSIPFPLVAPSANISNRISPTKASHVEKYFPNIYTLEGGACEAGVESTIVGMEYEEVCVYRWGAIGREAIENLVGKVLDRTRGDHAAVAPGMSKKHYSPTCQFIVSKEPGFLLSISLQKRVGVIWFNEVLWTGPNVVAYEVLSPTGNLEEAAKNIYDAMHRLEDHSLDLIIAERLPEHGLGISINDRLDRAAAQ